MSTLPLGRSERVSEISSAEMSSSRKGLPAEGRVRAPERSLIALVDASEGVDREIAGASGITVDEVVSFS
jgi:hypothetical protein